MVTPATKRRNEFFDTDPRKMVAELLLHCKRALKAVEMMPPKELLKNTAGLKNLANLVFELEKRTYLQTDYSKLSKDELLAQLKEATEKAKELPNGWNGGSPDGIAEPGEDDPT